MASPGKKTTTALLARKFENALRELADHTTLSDEVILEIAEEGMLTLSWQMEKLRENLYDPEEDKDSEVSTNEEE
jgi:hypothetical protein